MLGNELSLSLSRSYARQRRRTGPCGVHFSDQRRRAFFVTWRKVERHDGLGPDPARDLTGLVRRQMILARRMLPVLVQEHAFDEQQVHAGQQLRQRLYVRLGVAEVVT